MGGKLGLLPCGAPVDNRLRARERRATAEAELLSSTSNEVCERFDGNQIVRVLGAPDTTEFVFQQRTSTTPGDAWGLREAFEANKLLLPDSKRVMTRRGTKRANLSANIKMKALGSQPQKTSKDKKRQLTVKEIKFLEKLGSIAPNIILNAPNTVVSSRQRWTFALIGIISQLLVCVFGALTTYH